MATSRTLVGIRNIIAMAQCCSGNLAYEIVIDKRNIIDTTCAEKNLDLIRSSIDVLYNYDPTSSTNRISDAEAEHIIQNLYDLCDCLASKGDDVVETEVADCP